MMFESVHFRLLSTTPNMYVTNGLFLSGKGYKTIGIPIKNSTGIKPVPKGNKLGWTRIMIERHEREGGRKGVGERERVRVQRERVRVREGKRVRERKRVREGKRERERERE